MLIKQLYLFCQPDKTVLKMVLTIQFWMLFVQVLYIEAAEIGKEVTFNKYDGGENMAITSIYLDMFVSSRIECCLACGQSDRCTTVNYR